jgi:REP element-mobilizing transposase RayT
MNRIHLPDSIYYLTTVVYGRLPIFTTASYVVSVIDSLNFYRYKKKYKILGYVVMPDHLHLLIWLHGNSTISEIMRDLKKYTAVRIIRQAEVESRHKWLAVFEQAGAMTRRSQNKVWQDGFWDKIIYSDKMLRQKLNYIHRNPVRAGLVETADAYPYSSFRSYIEGDDSLILIDKDWL